MQMELKGGALEYSEIARHDLVDVAPSKATTLTDEIYSRLRSDILACRLTPGSKLSISKVCDNYGVNMAAVREALSRLSAEGLALAVPQRGYRVAPISLNDLRDLTAARIEIEKVCLASAIHRGGIEWETDLVGSYHRLSRTAYREQNEEARLSDAWVEAHALFHNALVSACDNGWLKRVRVILHEQSERYRQLSVLVSESTRDLQSEHQSIMEAALARQGDRAQSLLREHLTLTARILERAFSNAECHDSRSGSAVKRNFNVQPRVLKKPIDLLSLSRVG
jgi:DNA-binding GntR family transcriptional regulator